MQWLKGHELASLVAEAQAAIHVLADLDSASGVGGSMAVGWDLQAMTGEGEGIVVVHPASMLEAEDGLRVQSCRPGEISWLEFGRLFTEA